MTDGYEISTMTVADIAEAVALWAEAEYICTGDGVGYHGVVERYLRHNPGLSFVAREAETSRLLATLLAGTDGMYGTFRHALVLEEYRGRGIMSALIAKAVAGLQQYQVTEVFLYVLEGNEAGMEYFRRAGLQEIRGVKIFCMSV